jgi:hypothetical protein
LGSSVVALAIGSLGRALGVLALPDGAWILLVLGIDVAHVHATWFRTYFDTAELSRRPLRYALLPIVAYGACFFGYQQGALNFWRGLAYLAVFHFVRQQVGWVALYRSRERRHSRFDRMIDEGAVYAATLYPLLVWHAHSAEKGFSWFVPGDFVSLPLGAWLPALELVWLGALALFFLREGVRFARTRELLLGKSLIVACTALTWHVGIVDNDSDFMFTASNVTPHGVPYVWLLFAYTRARARERPSWGLGQLATAGLMSFAVGLVALAFTEQLAWDRFVDHERSWLFGASSALSDGLLKWVVPLLALPQAVHYLLDGVLWRRVEVRGNSALRAAIAAASPERDKLSDPLGLEVPAK